jgi:type II secretory pathway component GspD/PulD (secretin)
MWRNHKKPGRILSVSLIVIAIGLLCSVGHSSLLSSSVNPDPPAAHNEPQVTSNKPTDTNDAVQIPIEPNNLSTAPAKTESNKPAATKPPKVLPAEPNKPAIETAKPGLVSNVFIDTDLRQALQDIGSQVSVIIVPDESVTGMVTCKLENVPLDKALEIVLAGTGFVVKKTPDYYLVCSADPKSVSFPVVSETRLVKLNHIKADAAVKLLSTGFSDYVRANPDDNTVSITARPAVVERIISDLKLFDRPSRHVMLDARVVVMERGDLLNLGVEWGWPQISAGAFTDSSHHGLERGTQPEWPWGIQIGYTTGKAFTNSLLLTLNLLSQNNDATVIASPQVLAQDGQEAEIKVITEEYFKITSPSAYYVQFQLETIETGTTLKIKPRIGDNNEITLEMTTEVSDVISRGEDYLPVVTRRATKNTVRIKDGGTAALAGLMDSRTRLEKSEAPGLAGIPILGELFRSAESQRSSRQVAVFVTARLISETDKLVSQAVGTTIPIEPVGEEFKIALKEALSHLKATGGRQ